MARSLQRQAGFPKWSASIIITAFIAQFFYTEMLSDVANIYYTYLVREGTMWTQSNITLVSTLAAYVSIVFTFFGALLLSKVSSRIVCVISMIVIGINTIMIGSTDSFMVFAVNFFMTGLIGRILLLAIQGVVTNWYISTRGRVMGFYTIAGPIGTAFFPNLVTRLIEAGFSFSMVWCVTGVIVVALGVAFFFSIRNRPEDVNLSPDGIVRTEKEMEILNRQDAPALTTKQLLKMKETWLIGIGVAAWFITMSGILGFFFPRLMELGYSPINAANRLTLSSILGIFLSILWGIIDDKLGSNKACVGLAFSYFFMSLFMYLAGIFDGSSVLIWIAVVMVAFATGGIPNLQPSVIAYVYGRKQFMYANKIIMPIILLVCSPWAYMFSRIKESTGSFQNVYIICMIASLISAACFLMVRKSYDPERVNLEGVAK